MQTEYLLYGLAKGETREYMASLLVVTTNPQDIAKVRELASAEGWHSFRESTYKGEAPNFINTLSA
jgi:hypothetical protein